MGAGGELPGASRERRRRRAVTLAIGLAVLAAGLVVTLSQPAKRRIGTNNLPGRYGIGTAAVNDAVCQEGERIPAGTAAIRLGLTGYRSMRPRLSLALSDGVAIRARGGAGARWDGARAVVVPLDRTLRADVSGSICVRPLAGGSPVYQLLGIPTYPPDGATVSGDPLPGRMHLEYLPPGGGSWWSFAGTVMRRIGLGHAWSGAAVALLALLLLLASIALGAWQIVRGEA